MYWQEVPHRAASVVRTLLQSRGVLTAQRVPPAAPDARWGLPWCSVPPAPAPGGGLDEVVERLLKGELSVFGYPVSMPGGMPAWNTDPKSGQTIDARFGLFIDFRHLPGGLDIKFLWELNRHLWWVPLAQMYARSGDARCLERLRLLIGSWLQQCPYPTGANWASPVEHGIRLINWSIVWSLVGGAGSRLFEGAEGQALRQRWLDSIYQHIRFASDNYSRYSSADNHLIGEAAGVFVAAHTWDCWPAARRLRSEAKAILEREIVRQFSADGVCLEQALCYHKFSLQFLLAGALCGRANGDDLSPAYWARIESAFVFLAAMMDCSGKVPSIGDADDGNVWALGHGERFDSYRSMVAIGASLFRRPELQAKFDSVASEPDPQVPWLRCQAAAAATIPGDPRELPTVFAEGGYVVLGRSLHAEDELRVTMDCGPLGLNRIAGHGHADALSVLLSWEGDDLLVDSGTYCYNAEADLRRFFRGSSAHNVLVVDGRDQSEYGASFLWLRDVNSKLLDHRTEEHRTVVHACHDGYKRLADPVVHHRRVSLDLAQRLLTVEDWLECARPHEVTLFWHGPIGSRMVQVADGACELATERHRLVLSIDGVGHRPSIATGSSDPPQGWVSDAFYRKAPAPVWINHATLRPGQVLRSVIRCTHHHVHTQAAA